jgi:UDP-N-acetylglucosamine 2-epimerase (non-hydrolysing)
MMGLIKHSWKVITDSGGLQKESYFAGKQAVVVMPDTSWVELVQKKINALSEPEQISCMLFSGANDLFEEGIYGLGDAGAVIAGILGELR